MPLRPEIRWAQQPFLSWLQLRWISLNTLRTILKTHFSQF